ncbi:hypothetical protein CHS0354_042042 [Potamilus streckersoni]|uniref:Uncharacterized protein n=1 Tax=Potamilus streckersoni TaxID=2493646 RepID=A0AAE0T9Q9_9BIVA|nr:hypothetical protein CHS0354_042042 [Potamilus streckersoni]
MESTIAVGKLGGVAERSPVVYSANLKEDMLLKKKLHVLNRSEKGVIHRIKVEQKVIFRRFQNKLFRSKLSYAKLLGNKEEGRTLRHKSIGGLNSSCLDSEEDYGFLEKLERRPCTATHGERKPMEHIPNRAKERVSILNSGVESVGDDISKGDNVLVPRGRSYSTDYGKLKDVYKEVGSSFVSHLEEIRPVTTAGISKRTSAKKLVHLHERGKSADANIAKLGKDISDTSKKTHTAGESHSLKDYTEKQHRTSVSRQMQRRPSSFFEDTKPIDIISLRLYETKVRSLNFADQVKKFCEDLQQLDTGEKLVKDYYTIRIQSSIEKRRQNPLVSLPGTPEEEHRRAIGNINVKSLTVPKLVLYN